MRVSVVRNHIIACVRERICLTMFLKETIQNNLVYHQVFVRIFYMLDLKMVMFLNDDPFVLKKIESLFVCGNTIISQTKTPTTPPWKAIRSLTC